MKGSCSANGSLISLLEDRRMDSSHRPADELLEVVRVLLLLQGTVLVASTIEALFLGRIAAAPPAVALLTRFVLPVCVIALLRRAAQTPIAVGTVATAPAAS